MYQASVRSTTAGTTKTVLAIVAILSLLLSLFAITQPVAADHSGFDHQPLPIHTADFPSGTNAEDPEDEGDCANANLEPGQVLMHWIANHQNTTQPITLTLTVEGMAEPLVLTSYKSNNPGNINSNVTHHFETTVSGDVTITDLDISTNEGNVRLSHVCRGEEAENDETVTVIKHLVGDTAGTFDLLINGMVKASGVGDGGTTGAVVTPEGSVTVSENAAGSTDLTDYASSISCMAGETEVASGSGTSLQFMLGDNQDVVCTITNELNEEQPETGDLKVVKYFCEGTNDPQVVFVPLEEGASVPNLEDCVEGEATFSINGGDDLPTTNGVLLVNDLPVGTHTLAETDPNQASTDFEIVAGTETVIYVLNYEEQPDQGEIQIDKFFCPTEGDDRVEFEIRGPITPLNEAEEDDCTVGAKVTFVVTPIDPPGDPFEVVTGANGTIRFDVDAGTYTVTEKSTGETSDEFTVEAGALTLVIVKNFEGEEQPDLGSITVTKVVDCEECETRTIGYYFNTADQHEEETNGLFTSLGGIEADGITFTNVDQVQQYRADDQNGTSDGQNGLSARGQLTLQYLAAVLNTARNGEDCDLASQVYNNPDSPFDGWTVQQILDEAVAAFDGTSTFTDEQIKSALDDINNSSHEEENPLSCGETESGTLDDVTFDIYLAEDYPDGDPLDSQTTANGGVATFEGLVIGEDYVIVESGFPDGMTCTIVDVSGGNAEIIDGAIHVTLTSEDADLELTAVNDCEQPGEEEEFGEIEIVKSAEDDPEASFAFSATWDTDGFTLMDGDSEFSGLLPAGESFTVTEELTQEQIDAGWSLEDIDCGEAMVDVSEDGMSVTITVVADETITCTFTNEQEEEENGQGELELIKWFCPQVDEPQIFVLGPVGEEPLPELRTQSESTLPSQDGCSIGATADGETVAEFTISGGPEGFEEMTVETTLDEILTLDLDPGSYTITESNTGLTANFTIEEGEDTAVVVFNYLPEEEGQGRLKIIKFFCDGETDDVVFSIVEGEMSVGDVDAPAEATNCEVGDAAFTLNDGDTDSASFTIGSDGIRLIPLDEGTYTLSEIAPNTGTSDEFDVTEDETTTVVVFNLSGGGTGGEETVQVSIMKHLCGDISTVAEFEAVEDAGVAGIPGGQGTLSGLAATVLACPAIVLTGDVPTSGAVTGGNIDFDFSVIDSDGTQVLSSDGTFEQAALCESGVDIDVNEDGDKTDCLDTSHYMFAVVDGVVVITETDAPEGSTGVGTLRFTPGSGDESALVGTIAGVEASGVIVLDTSKASETAVADGIMLHVYNFAEAGTSPNEGTKGNQGGPKTGEGTLAGQLPNTATEPFNGTSMPVALVALLMLSGLGAAAYAMRAEAARRR